MPIYFHLMPRIQGLLHVAQFAADLTESQAVELLRHILMLSDEQLVF